MRCINTFAIIVYKRRKASTCRCTRICLNVRHSASLAIHTSLYNLNSQMHLVEKNNGPGIDQYPVLQASSWSPCNYKTGEDLILGYVSYLVPCSMNTLVKNTEFCIITINYSMWLSINNYSQLSSNFFTLSRVHLLSFFKSCPSKWCDADGIQNKMPFFWPKLCLAQAVMLNRKELPTPVSILQLFCKACQDQY